MAELENTMMMQGSHSSESVLTGVVPPPKPSKDRIVNAPPLPPKKKTFSVDGMPDETDNTRQLSTRSENLFSRRIDFNNYEDDGFTINDLSRDNLSPRAVSDLTNSFSTNERHLVASKAINETELTQSTLKQFNKHNFTSIDSRECRIKISEEYNSRVFQSMSSDVHDIENNLSFLSLNQSEFMTEAASNESFSMLDTSSEELPPPLPVKTRSRSLRSEHHKSVYDNVDDMNRNSLDAKASITSSNSSLTSSLSARTENTNDFNSIHHSIVKNKYKSCIEAGSSFCIDESNGSCENPPPLPLKKKHSKYPFVP